MRLRLLPIQRPCSESFAAMPGDAKTRYCAKCEEHVYDLSQRTEEEARALYRDAGTTKLCVRYAKDAAGGILFKAAAMAAMVAATGCAATIAETPPVTAVETDTDMGEGVIDTVDRCPDEPTTNDDGCPDPAPGDVTPTPARDGGTD